MFTVTRYWQGALTLAFVAVVALAMLNPSPRESAVLSSEAAKDKPAPAANGNSHGLAGTASCSARGCHGAIDSTGAPDRCGQNEYLQWTRDPHADAYRVLFNERSERIAKNLAGIEKYKKYEKEPHKNPDCLACHATPQAVPLLKDPEHSLARQEIQFGVGCESCHGSAGNWVVSHTAGGWRKNAQEKQELMKQGMIDVTSLAKRAELCAGCHVGAPAEDGKPLRNMNHDMIAAGHPRLMFEFGTYHANMPTHWREKKNLEAYLWTIGQLATAEASLKLLAARANDGPWPEFAEYDCFACHHGLAAPTWRQAPVSRGRKPGALPFGTWSFALTRQLAQEVNKSSLPELDALTKSMQKAYPDRKQVNADALKPIEALRKLAATLDPKDFRARSLILNVLANDRVDPNWDTVEQLYFALHAVQASEADKKVETVLTEVTPLRAFPVGFDSPRSINGKEKAFHPEEVLKKLRLKP